MNLLFCPMSLDCMVHSVAFDALVSLVVEKRSQKATNPLWLLVATGEFLS